MPSLSPLPFFNNGISAMPVWRQQPLHRVLVQYYKDGIEEVDSFYTKTEALKFKENKRIEIGVAKTTYFGPGAELPDPKDRG